MSNYVRPAGTRARVPVPAGEGTMVEILVGPDEAPNFALRRFVMEPGGGMPLHTNLVEHEQYVLSGSAEVRIGGETVQVTPGDAVYIPAQIPHSYRAGADGFVFLCAVPNQEDRIEILS